MAKKEVLIPEEKLTPEPAHKEGLKINAFYDALLERREKWYQTRGPKKYRDENVPLPEISSQRKRRYFRKADRLLRIAKDPNGFIQVMQEKGYKAATIRKWEKNVHLAGQILQDKFQGEGFAVSGGKAIPSKDKPKSMDIPELPEAKVVEEKIDPSEIGEMTAVQLVSGYIRNFLIYEIESDFPHTEEVKKLIDSRVRPLLGEIKKRGGEQACLAANEITFFNGEQSWIKGERKESAENKKDRLRRWQAVFLSSDDRLEKIKLKDEKIADYLKTLYSVRKLQFDKVIEAAVKAGILEAKPEKKEALPGGLKAVEAEELKELSAEDLVKRAIAARKNYHSLPMVTREERKRALSKSVIPWELELERRGGVEVSGLLFSLTFSLMTRDSEGLEGLDKQMIATVVEENFITFENWKPYLSKIKKKDSKLAIAFEREIAEEKRILLEIAEKKGIPLEGIEKSPTTRERISQRWQEFRSEVNRRADFNIGERLAAILAALQRERPNIDWKDFGPKLSQKLVDLVDKTRAPKLIDTLAALGVQLKEKRLERGKEKMEDKRIGVIRVLPSPTAIKAWAKEQWEKGVAPRVKKLSPKELARKWQELKPKTRRALAISTGVAVVVVGLAALAQYEIVTRHGKDIQILTERLTGLGQVAKELTPTPVGIASPTATSVPTAVPTPTGVSIPAGIPGQTAGWIARMKEPWMEGMAGMKETVSKVREFPKVFDMGQAVKEALAAQKAAVEAAAQQVNQAAQQVNQFIETGMEIVKGSHVWGASRQMAEQLFKAVENQTADPEQIKILTDAIKDIAIQNPRLSGVVQPGALIKLEPAKLAEYLAKVIKNIENVRAVRGSLEVPASAADLEALTKVLKYLQGLI